MQDDSSHEDSPPRLKSKISEQRACDDCRARKIRCDRKKPCSHCKTAGLLCRTTTERPKEARARVTISKQYETKIDRIEYRLASIEHLLRSSNSSAKSPIGLLQPTPSSANSGGDLQNDRLHFDDDSNVHVVGSAGPHADSLAAKDILEQTLNRNASLYRDPQLSAALASLQGMVETIKTGGEQPVSKKNNIHLPQAPAGPSSVNLPAWDDVKPLLEHFKRHPPPMFAYYIPFLSYQEFYDKCYRFYESQETNTPATRVIVYAGLYSLFSDLALQERAEEMEKHNAFSLAFQKELLNCLFSLPLMMPVNMESVEALMSGAFVAIDACRPSLCWTLSCSAIRLCQTMGYHRASSIVNDTAALRNKKTVLFWMAYVMDRNTGLRLGRSPAIQDFDITIGPPQESDYLPFAVMKEFEIWVSFARTQGQINDRLYGPAGLAATPEERTQLAQAFADDLHAIYQYKQKYNDLILADLGPTIEPIMASDTIMYYSTLTLALHAAAKPHEVSKPTLEAARLCLKASRDLSRKNAKDHYTWSMWCHWVLLQTPLTPLTVMFSHIIRHYETSQPDLRLLQEFVSTLEFGRSVSEGVDKYYRMCSVLTEVATAYVNAKAKEAADQQLCSQQPEQPHRPVTNYFDARLSQMGFAALQPPIVEDSEAAIQPWPQGDSNDYLSDWYSTNTLLYGILEQDLNSFGTMDFDYGTDMGSGL